MKITINLKANDLTLAMGYRAPRIRRYILILCAIKLSDLNWDPRLFDVGYVSGGQEIFFEGIQVTFKLKVNDNLQHQADGRHSDHIIQ